jgi:hypothetical protein
MVKKLSWRRFWAILAIMAIVPAVLVTAYLASFEKPGPKRRDCPEPVEGIEAQLDVTIEHRSADPRATVMMVVDMPYDNGLAWDLLRRTRDDDRHKLALVCVIGGPAYLPDQEERDQRETEQRKPPVTDWDQQEPSVAKEGDRVVVRTRTTKALSTFTGAQNEIGPLVIQALDPQHWRATIRQPSLLALARWREVSVTAPEGWLSGSQPYLTPTVDVQRISWERLGSETPGTEAERVRWERPAQDTSSDADNLAIFTIHPDMRTQITSSAQTTRWLWATYVLGGLSTLMLVALLVLWAHRSRATLVRRMCLPILAVTLTVMADKIVSAYHLYLWWDVLLELVIIVLVAIAWGMPRTASVAVVAEAGLAFVIMVLVAVLATETAFNTVWLAAGAVLAFQLTLLLVSGLINAARVLLADSRSQRASLKPPLWVWFSGAALAAALVVEQFVNIHGFMISWADTTTLSVGDAAGALWWSPSIILVNLERVVPFLAIIGAWALVRDRLEDQERKADRFVILLFIMGAVTWQVAPFGQPLPVWPLAWLVLWLWLRHSRPMLDAPLAWPGSTVRSVIEKHPPNELRGAAAMWGRIRHRGRGLDRELAKGAISLDEHAAETKKLLDISLLPDPEGQTIKQLREASVTPVDVVLALGPKSTPMENAKQGAKIAAMVGAPAAALELWLTWHQPSLPQRPTLWRSDLLTWITAVGWQVATWLVAGAVLGLLWQRWPCRIRRGIAKALPLISAYAAANLVLFATVELGGDNSRALLGIALFAAVTMVTALWMDLDALRSNDTWWSRRRDALAAAYGMENLATQVTFVAAQVVAVITVLDFLSGGIQEQPADRPAPPPVVDQTDTPFTRTR